MNPGLIGIAIVGTVRAISRTINNRKDQKRFQRERAAQEATARDKARCFCEACSTGLSQEASFCHQCGSSSITTLGNIRERERAEEDRRQRELREIKWKEVEAKQALEERRARFEAARKICREIASRSYCAKCRAEREPIHKFCIQCGGIVQPMPSSIAFERAHKEFPDLVCTEMDFQEIVK